MVQSFDNTFVPQCRVYVDGTRLASSEVMLESVSVELSVSQMSNSCELVFFSGYDHEHSRTGDILSKMEVGGKIRVELGYELPKTVFIGYINSQRLDYSSSGAVLSVSCLDARGLLMGNNSRESFENKSISQVVKELLEPVRAYTDGINVSLAGSADKETPLSQYEMDDYQFVCRLAKLTGCSFYMNGTKLNFVKDIYSTAALKDTFAWGKELISFSRSVELSEQIGKVRVIGSEPDTGKPFYVDASPIGGFGGKTGEKLCKPVGKRVKEVVCKSIKTRKEAETFAESLMRQSCLALCKGRASVVGCDIKPGEKVKFSGLDPNVNGTYYVTGVTHNFSASGYTTDITFCSPTA